MYLAIIVERQSHSHSVIYLAPGCQHELQTTNMSEIGNPLQRVNTPISALKKGRVNNYNIV